MIRSIAVTFSLAILFLAPARAYAVENAANPNPCSPNATCTTTGSGTFACACKPGYVGDGRTCQEINVCLRDGVLVTVIFSAPTPINQGLKVTFQQQGLTDRA